MKKDTFLKGSLILTASAAGAKLLGACFKLPLTAVLGGTGMGYFSTAYGLFLPLYAVLVTGLSTAVARPVAFCIGQGRPAAAEAVRRTARGLFFLLGLLGSALAVLCAEGFTRRTSGSLDALPAVLAITPAVLLCCLTAAERGYYEGLCRMTPTALSQLAEAAVKLVCGLLLCRYCMETPPAILAGCSREAAGACGAVMGVTLGALAGYVTTLFCGRRRVIYRKDADAPGTKELVRSLFSVMIPAALGALVTNLTSLIDLVTVMRSFSAMLREDAAAFYAGAHVPETVPPGEAAAFVYGSFMGLAVTVFNLVPSLTNMLAKGVLPCTAQAWSAGNRHAAADYARQVLLLTGLAAVPAAFGLAALSREVLLFLYAGRPEEVGAAWESLVCLSPGLVCLCLAFPVFSLLQAVGREDLPVKILLPGAAVKLACNLLLLPRMYAAGAALSTSICYAVILIAALVCLRKTLGEPLRVGRFLLAECFGGLLCGAAAWVCCGRLTGVLPERAAFLLAVCAGAGVYGAVLLLMMPKRKS